MADTILLAEDENDTMLFLETILMNEGYEEMQVLDVTEEMQKLWKRNPGLVCLDMALPKRSSLDLLREINSDKRLHMIPVVVVSGFMSTKANSVELQALIHDDVVHEPENYIGKPTDPNKLLAKVGKSPNTDVIFTQQYWWPNAYVL